MFSAPTTLLLIAVWSMSALAILFFARRWSSGQPLVTYRPRRNVPWTGAAVIVAILGWMFIRGFGAELYFQINPPSSNQPAETSTEASEAQPAGEEKSSSAAIEITSPLILCDAVFSLLAVVVICGIMKLACGASWKDLGFCFDSVWADLRLGIVAGMAAIPCLLLLQMALTQWIPSKHQIVELVEQQSDASTMAIMFFSAVIVAPLSEEFFIRSILQGWLEKRSNEHQTQLHNLANSGEPGDPSEVDATLSEDSPVAEADLCNTSLIDEVEPAAAEPLRGWYAALPILFSSGCFAAMHIGYGPDPIPIFLLAIALGFLYQRTHRLFASITLHALLNGTSLVLLWASLAAG